MTHSANIGRYAIQYQTNVIGRYMTYSYKKTPNLHRYFKVFIEKALVLHFPMRLSQGTLNQGIHHTDLLFSLILHR